MAEQSASVNVRTEVGPDPFIGFEPLVLHTLGSGRRVLELLSGSVPEPPGACVMLGGSALVGARRRRPRVGS